MLALIAALLLLNASLTFENVWPTPWVRWTASLSAELAGGVLLLCLLAWRSRRIAPATIRTTAIAWMLLVIGRYAQVTAPALYGRDINLYWDARYIPDVVALSVRVAPLWLLALGLAVAVLAIGLVYAAMSWALRQVAAAAARRGPRLGLMFLSVVVIAIFIRQTPVPFEWQPIATPVVQAYAHQVALIAQALDTSRPITPSPPMETTLEAVKDADVFLVFVEAYGAVSFDRPDFAGPLAPSRAALVTDIHDTGRDVVSAFIDSTTFGGSSWLAHISLMSGIEVRDQNTNARLMSEDRQTLVHVFQDHGYRTVAMMPGLRQVWPEGAFYHFDDTYGATRLDYHGPEFGWFAVPDQFSLDRIETLEVRKAPRAPLFLFFPTISTHFPFSPTPPYQPDWDRMIDPLPYDGPALTDAYSIEPDWDNFGPGYVRALSYDYASLGGYLRRRQSERDVVMILIGDHQPAAAVSGAGASWAVPIHIITSRTGLIDRLVARGFNRGLTPERPQLASMSGLLPILLDAFGSEFQ